MGTQGLRCLSEGHPSSSALEDHVSFMKEGHSFPDSPYLLGPSELHPVSPQRHQRPAKPNQAGPGAGHRRLLNFYRVPGSRHTTLPALSH